MAKAQILGQVVVFMLAGIVFVLILGYGYRAITGFLEKGKQVALIDFKTDFETAVESISRDYGSIRTFSLTVPSGFHTLCIVDPENPGNLQASHPLLYNAWRSGSENIFLLPIGKQPFPMKIEAIEIPGGFICFENIQGSATMQFEGMGDKAKITQKAAGE